MTIVHTKDRDWYLLVSRLERKTVSSAIEVSILDSAVKQSIPRDWLPVVFVAEEEPLPIISVDNEVSFDFFKSTY